MFQNSLNLKAIGRTLFAFIQLILEILLLPFLVIAALICHFHNRRIDIGIGPTPSVAHPYHKQCLEKYGYTAETFVTGLWNQTAKTKFDVRGDLIFAWIPVSRVRQFVINIFLFLRAMWYYRCVYTYHNGVLGDLHLLWHLEPHLWRLANVKTVVSAFGSDVQYLVHSPSLLFKHGMSINYPHERFRQTKIAAQINLWACYATHVISGCDWVYYMPYWNTLVLNHFAIETESWMPVKLDPRSPNQPIRLLHAPNHRFLKGTTFFERAVKELQDEGVNIELIILEGIPNDKVREVMANIDIIADQLIVGWYAMFAIEGMAMGKPVLCYLDSNLEAFFVNADVVKEQEIPIVNCTPTTVKDTIRHLVQNPEQLDKIGQRSRAFVEKYHSIAAIGQIFDHINRSMGFFPRIEAKEG